MLSESRSFGVDLDQISLRASQAPYRVPSARHLAASPRWRSPVRPLVDKNQSRTLSSDPLSFMKLAVALALGIFALSGARTKNAPVCFSTREIAVIEPQGDGRVLLFTMRNGSVWRNDLVGWCPNLRFNGFAWFPPTSKICEHEQSLRVQHSGEICSAGKFSEILPARQREMPHEHR